MSTFGSTAWAMEGATELLFADQFVGLADPQLLMHGREIYQHQGIAAEVKRQSQSKKEPRGKITSSKAAMKPVERLVMVLGSCE